MIPAADPKAQYLSHKAEIVTAIHDVLEKGRYILGEQAAAFEEEFAAYIGVEHGAGVGSGTEALHVALAACGIGAGDEVITVAHTAVATVSAIELCGATPVLVDIDPLYYTIDPAKVEAAITPRSKAIIAVHIYGHAADLQPLLEIAARHNLRLIEDCAQAHGATYRGRKAGAWGDISCFSFYPTKNLGAIGDGGFVATNDAALAQRTRLLREYGWLERYVSHITGWNSRLDELQAAVLRVKLRTLDEDNAKRARLAEIYTQGLRGTEWITPRQREGSTHVYHLYVIRAGRRDAVQEYLKTQGVGSLVHYPVPVHLQPGYVGRLPGAQNLPETERAAKEVLSLPMYPELTEEQAQAVVRALRQFST